MADSSSPEKSATKALYRRPEVVRLLVIALLAEIAYAVLNLSTMTVYLRDDRHFGESVIGLVVVSFLLFEAVFKGPMGHFADRFGPKLFISLGPALSILTSLLSLAVPHSNGQPGELVAFLVLRAIDGVGAAMLWPAAFSAINEVVEDGERQQAMSLLNLCYMLGIAVAFIVGGSINDLFHLKYAALILAAGLFAIVSLVAWRFVPRFTPKPGSAAEGESTGLADFLASVKQVPGFILLAGIMFMGIGFPMAIFKLFPTDQFGFSETAIGAIIFPGALTMAAASVPMSRIGEKIGRIRSVNLGVGLSALGMAFIASGMLIPSLRQPWVLAIGGIPCGIGFLLAIPAWMASVSDIDPAKRGTNLGAIMTAQGLGAIIGAPIGSAFYEKMQPVGVSLGLGVSFGRYSPFMGCAICLAVGWLLSLKILKPLDK
jgi:MFS family permease